MNEIIKYQALFIKFDALYLCGLFKVMIFTLCFSSAQKFLLPIEYNEATKNLKRRLKYFDSFENPCFLFLADERNMLSIYLNSCFPVARVNIAELCGTDGVLTGAEILKIKKIKATNDLSKLFLQIQIENTSFLSIVDTRFIGYKSGMITDISKLLFEVNEYIKFIENKTEECTTFWNITSKKYNAEMGIMERSLKSVEKSSQTNKLSSGASSSTSVGEQLRLLLVYSMMSKGIQKYIETIAKERKELVKREEIIQGELDKIENLVTNFIMPSVEVVLLKLETLKKLAKQKEKYEILGLDYKTIEGVIMEFFLLYQKFEELNLSIVETKLDIK